MAGIFDNLPGYLKVSDAGGRGSCGVSETHHADVIQARRMGFV